MTRAPKVRKIRRLLKNFNIAPCADGFQPDINLVIHSLLNDVVPYGVGYLREWRNRIQSAALRFRHKNLVVIFFEIVIRWPDELSEPQIEILLHPDPSSDGITDRRGGCAFLRRRLFQVVVDLVLCDVGAGKIGALAFNQVVIDHFTDERGIIIWSLHSKPSSYFAFLADIAEGNDVAFDDRYHPIDHLRAGWTCDEPQHAQAAEKLFCRVHAR